MSKTRSSFLFRNLALEVSGLPLSRKAVFAAICTHADRKGVCWPSEATLARAADCHERTVRRSLNDLEALGLIRRRRRSESGKTCGYVYAVIPPIGLLVSSSGLCALNRPDTKTAHNYIRELIKELEGTGLADLLNKVWEELSPVIPHRKLVELFSLFPVVEHLLSKPDEEAVQGFRRLPAAARRLREDLEASESELLDWSELFPYLLEDSETPGQEEPRTLPDIRSPILESLSKLIENAGVPSVRAKMMLEGFQANMSGRRIELTASIPARLSILRSNHEPVLRQLAKEFGRELDLVLDGAKIDRIRPG